jgi:hypothetical protein
VLCVKRLLLFLPFSQGSSWMFSCYMYISGLIENGWIIYNWPGTGVELVVEGDCARFWGWVELFLLAPTEISQFRHLDNITGETHQVSHCSKTRHRHLSQ